MVVLNLFVISLENESNRKSFESGKFYIEQSFNIHLISLHVIEQVENE